MNWIIGDYDVNGVRMHYERTGGAKPPLILLHGLMGSGARWRYLARSFEAEFDVVMPDARGHGKSSAPLGGYRYNDLASDVVRLICGLELDAPFLLGHSMGGMTAAVVASQLGKDIRGVVLADPAFLSPERQREVHVSDIVEQHRQLLSRNKEEVLAEARSRTPHRSSEILELQVEARFQTRMNAFDVLTPPYPDYRQLVGTIGVPVLLIIGDAGNVVSMETARELQELNPQVRVEQIHDASHGVPYDQPERFAMVVGAFLSSVT